MKRAGYNFHIGSCGEVCPAAESTRLKEFDESVWGSPVKQRFGPIHWTASKI